MVCLPCLHSARLFSDLLVTFLQLYYNISHLTTVESWSCTVSLLSSAFSKAQSVWFNRIGLSKTCRHMAEL